MMPVYIGRFQPTGDDETDELIIRKFRRLGYVVEPDYQWELNRGQDDSFDLEMEIDLDPRKKRL